MEFTVLKTKLYVSPLFFAVLTAFLLLDKSGTAGKTVLFSFLHEAGHFMALLYAKTYPHSVEITLFGIHMRLPQNLSTEKKCIVLMAGFLLNFIFAAALFILNKNISAYVNLFIGIFTSVPIAATDGGAVLKMFLEEYFSQKSEKIFKIISFLFMAIISFLIISTIYFTKNYFLIIALAYMVLCTIKDAA